MTTPKNPYHYSRIAFFWSIFTSAFFIFTLSQHNLDIKEITDISLFLPLCMKMLGAFVIIGFLTSIWSILIWEISNWMKWTGFVLNTILFVLYINDSLFHGLLRMVW